MDGWIWNQEVCVTGLHPVHWHGIEFTLECGTVKHLARDVQTLRATCLMVQACPCTFASLLMINVTVQNPTN